MSIFDLKISREERFLINVLFKERKDIKKEIDLEKIDYELLVKIASGHLMLPSFYVNLKNKGFIDLIPSDLKMYLKEIFTINKNRNQVLLNEAKEISEILIINDINHVFVKGTSYIFNNIYDDIGERMVGDIDFLVSKKDFTKTIELLKKLNYRGSKPMTSYAKHYGRLVNIEKIFAVEIHIGLLSKEYNKKMTPEFILKNKVNLNNKIYTPNNEQELLYNIYNFQINDYGSNKLSYSYRSFYDTFMLIKHPKTNLNKIKTDNYINNYLMIAKELRILNFEFSKIHKKKLNLFRFKLKTSKKLYFSVDDFICNTIIAIELKRKQIIEIIINRSFRKYAIKKILTITFGKKIFRF